MSLGRAPLEIQCAMRSIFKGVVILLLRIVVPDDLDELAVARAAAVGDDDFVVRGIGRAFAAEAD